VVTSGWGGMGEEKEMIFKIQTAFLHFLIRLNHYVFIYFFVKQGLILSINTQYIPSFYITHLKNLKFTHEKNQVSETSPARRPKNRLKHTRIHLQSSQKASNIVDAARSRARQRHRATSYTLNEYQPPSCDETERKNYPPPPTARRTSHHYHRRYRPISQLIHKKQGNR
jgi:hypothetical protein